MKILAFIFDFDGVIIDSVRPLYDVYVKFLNAFNISANDTKKDFEKLNGVNLDGIISYIAEKYLPLQQHSVLKELYEKMINETAAHAILIDGVDKLLHELHSDGYPLFIVTQASRRYVETILSSYNLLYLFTSITCADNRGSKTEKYLSVKRDNPEKVFIVTEDSDSGIVAALKAGHKVVFYNPEKRHTVHRCDYEINNYSTFYGIVEDAVKSCFTIDASNNIKMRVVDFALEIDENTRDKIDRLWESESRDNNKLYNSPILCYHSHFYENDRLVINVFWSWYKFFLCRYIDNRLDTGAYPVGVSGIMSNSSGAIIGGERTGCTQYNGYLELVPSGSIDKQSSEDNIPNAIEQITHEYIEEFNGSSDDINSIEYLGFIYDFNDKVYDICMKIELNTYIDSENLPVSNEYAQFFVIPAAVLETFSDKMIPTSKEIAKLLRIY